MIGIADKELLMSLDSSVLEKTMDKHEFGVENSENQNENLDNFSQKINFSEKSDKVTKQELPPLTEEQAEQSLDVIYEISRLMNCGISREKLGTCIKRFDYPITFRHLITQLAIGLHFQFSSTYRIINLF